MDNPNSFFVILRLYGISNPLSEQASWRQADTAAMAANMVENFSIFPQLDYDGPPPNYAELEFPLLPLVAYPFFKIFGVTVPIARALALLFSTISLIFLVLLAQLKLGEKAGFIAGFVYALLPFNIFYNRAVLPEPVLLGMSLGSLYFFSLYLEQGGKKYWILSTVFLLLSILSKPSFLFLGLLLLLLLLEKKGMRGLVDFKIWLMALLALVPSIAYFCVSHSLAESKYLTSLLSLHMLPNFFQTLASSGFWEFLFNRLGDRVLTWAGLTLFLLFFICSPFFKKSRFLFFWNLSVIIFFAFSTVPVLYQHDYYQLMLVPPFALSLGWLFEKISQAKVGKYQLKNVAYGLLILACFLIFSEGMSDIGKFWNVDPFPLKIGERICLLTPENSLIAIDQPNPIYLFYSRRDFVFLTN